MHGRWPKASLTSGMPPPARHAAHGRCEDRERSGQLSRGTWPGVWQGRRLAPLLQLNLRLARSHLGSPLRPSRRRSLATAKGPDAGSQLQPLESPGAEPMARPGVGLATCPRGCRVSQQPASGSGAKDPPHTGFVPSRLTRGPNLGRSGSLSPLASRHGPALQPASTAAALRQMSGEGDGAALHEELRPHRPPAQKSPSSRPAGRLPAAPGQSPADGPGGCTQLLPGGRGSRLPWGRVGRGAGEDADRNHSAERS